MTKYSLSWDGGTYHSDYETKEEAEQAGFNDPYSKERGWFWVGECVPPRQPEDLWYAEDWLEHVSCHEEYSGEWAEDWDQSTREQREELEREVRGVMAAWLDRHGLRPRFWNIENPYKLRCPNDHQP